MPSQPLTDTEKQLIDAYNTILEKPFVDKYEDRWEDEPFDRAIDLFKCDPCLQAGPEVSQLAEEFAGRVAFLGINNESMFQKDAITTPPNMDRIIAFVEEHQDEFRYTILIDNAEGFAKYAVYRPAGYRGIPCAVLLVDGIVQYVGSPIDTLRPALEQALESISSSSTTPSRSASSNTINTRSSSGRSSREE
ncbi:hypothetical protein BGX23_004830 [Mortierella sp. AD031]|nr:hypothetical protein BGX23_004830 [Mortierella sp. AD031]